MNNCRKNGIHIGKNSVLVSYGGWLSEIVINYRSRRLWSASKRNS